MIIKDVQLYRNGEATVLSARCKIRKIGWDTIYLAPVTPYRPITSIAMRAHLPPPSCCPQ
jgi:hypothetical protein